MIPYLYTCTCDVTTTGTSCRVHNTVYPGTAMTEIRPTIFVYADAANRFKKWLKKQNKIEAKLGAKTKQFEHNHEFKIKRNVTGDY